MEAFTNRDHPVRVLASMPRSEIAVLVIVLLIAAILRVAWPSLTEFKADEGRLLTAALEMRDGEFALRGISSSVGFPNAPMSVWLYSLPLLIWPHPYAATIFTGILSVIAVAGVYWLSRRYWGFPAAIVAALFLTVSPWAILFSRKIWAQDLLPIFAVGWAIAAALTFIEGRRPFIVLHLVCLAIAVQTHPGALGLFPATLLFLVIFHRRIDWRYLALGGVVSATTAVPYLWYLWQRFQAEGGLPFSSGQSTAEISTDSLRMLFNLAIGEGLAPLAASSYGGLPGVDAVRLILLILILAGAGWAAWQAAGNWRKPAAQMGFICLAWFLMPALLFIWHRTPVYIHYFIVALPAPYILVGAFFEDALDRLRVRWIAWLAIGVIALLQLVVWVNLMISIARDPVAGGFGIPLGVKARAADAAKDMFHQTGAAEVLLIGEGSNPEQDDFPAEFRALLHGVPIRYVDLNAEAVFPATRAIVLMETDLADDLTSTRDLYATASAEAISIPAFGSLAYTVHKLPPASAPQPDVNLPQPALLQNFVHLTGYNALRDQVGGVLWDVYWRPADNPDPSDYHIFNHLMDGTGSRVAQADAAAFSGMQWRPGDLVISRFLLKLPTDFQPPLAMRVGMYRFPGLDNVPVLDEAANPAADALIIPLRD